MGLSVGRSIGLLVGGPLVRSCVCLLVGWLVVAMVGWMCFCFRWAAWWVSCWLLGWLVSLLVGWAFARSLMVGRLLGWLVRWLFGWLVS